MSTVARRKRGSKTAFPCPHCREEIALVGTKEAVELLGTTASTFQSWREREDFPEPLWNAGQGALWQREDIETWHRARSTHKAKDLAGKLAASLNGLDGKTAEEALMALLESLRAKQAQEA